MRKLDEEEKKRRKRIRDNEYRAQNKDKVKEYNRKYYGGLVESTIDRRVRELENKMDGKIEAIRTQYQERIAKFNLLKKQ